MWVAKFTVRHERCILTPLCVKHKVTDFVSLLSAWQEKDRWYYTEFHTLQGKEENIRKFAKSLRKKVRRLDRKGNIIFTLNEEPLEMQFYAPVFDRRIIQVKPVIVHHDGLEYWEVAAWDKKPLMDLIKVHEFESKIQSIQRTRLSDIFFPRIFPKLPPKQREAIELAVREGYYNYPRDHHLDDLAGLAGVRRQTYQENLRRAEQKIVPFLTKSLPKIRQEESLLND